MIRQYALTYKELTDRLKEIEGKFDDIYEAIDYLLDKDKHEIEQRQRKRKTLNAKRPSFAEASAFGRRSRPTAGEVGGQCNRQIIVFIITVTHVPINLFIFDF